MCKCSSPLKVRYAIKILLIVKHCVLYLQIFRKGLTRMFADSGRDCVFMETSINLKRYPHMVIECVPMPKEVGEMAPIYFKVKYICKCCLKVVCCTVSHFALCKILCF